MNKRTRTWQESPADTIARGTRWRNIGSERPAQGEKLVNAKLERELCLATTFTQDKWERFGIDKLRMHHFVKAGPYFYQPYEAETKERYDKEDTGKTWVLQVPVYESEPEYSITKYNEGLDWRNSRKRNEIMSFAIGYSVPTKDDKPDLSKRYWRCVVKFKYETSYPVVRHIFGTSARIETWGVRASVNIDDHIADCFSMQEYKEYNYNPANQQFIETELGASERRRRKLQ